MTFQARVAIVTGKVFIGEARKIVFGLFVGYVQVFTAVFVFNEDDAFTEQIKVSSLAFRSNICVPIVTQERLKTRKAATRAAFAVNR